MNLNLHARDSFKWWPIIEVAKFHPATAEWVRDRLGREPLLADFEALGIAPDEVVTAEGNDLTTAGLARIAALISGTGQAFEQGNAVIGVGNGSTAFSPAQTDLVGASKYFQATTSVNASGAVITAVATFGGSNANFAWEEWCWVATDSAAASQGTKPNGVMLNRKVQQLGTKASGASWTLTTTVTLS